MLKLLDPTQQLVGIVHKELIDLMGPVDHSLHLRKGVSVLMLCGLQGSGKTTTCGKLGRLINDRGVKPMLVAADLQRPAAIHQLEVLGESWGCRSTRSMAPRIRWPFARRRWSRPTVRASRW